VGCVQRVSCVFDLTRTVCRWPHSKTLYPAVYILGNISLIHNSRGDYCYASPWWIITLFCYISYLWKVKSFVLCYIIEASLSIQMCIYDWLIDWLIVFNATFSNISAISWQPVLVVEEAGVPRENHRPWASNW
jgi:hypothetical protein